MVYCTLFDSNYILKGLAMYKSLMARSSDSLLYVMAFDDGCYKKLIDLNLPNLVVDNINSIEDDTFIRLKNERSRAEYCWTCGPSVIYFFLVKYSLQEIIYLDSDLFFLGNPQIVLDEIAGCSVAITEQGISERSASLLGRYCVQYLYFKNDTNGIAALEWWRDSCIKWCYARVEDGKFGDQKYLDQFPTKFNNVYVVKNLGVGIAPWNMFRYKFNKEALTICYKNISYPAVFFHMHGLGFFIENNVLIVKVDSYLPESVRKAYFIDYAEIVKETASEYLGYSIVDYKIVGKSWFNRAGFVIKERFRTNKCLRFLYYRIKHN